MDEEALYLLQLDFSPKKNPLSKRLSCKNEFEVVAFILLYFGGGTKGVDFSGCDRDISSLQLEGMQRSHDSFIPDTSQSQGQ